MAEGGPRRAGPVWLWVLGLVLIVVLLFVLLGAAPPAASPGVDAGPPSLLSYTQSGWEQSAPDPHPEIGGTP